MSILDSFDTLVAERLSELIELGRTRYSRTPAAESEQRRSLGVQTESADFEILVWSTGDVEFGYGNPDDNHDEHFQVASKDDLESLVERLVDLARGWPRKTLN